MKRALVYLLLGTAAFAADHPCVILAVSPPPAQWVPTNDGIPTGGVQVCNFDTSDDAVDYAGKSGLSLDTVERPEAIADLMQLLADEKEEATA